ncbi:hypothetical protein NMY22_g2288 [Coprinellus aureogranulatus]|nr:hypothetical protein NMY22_g2288 [Coprinellus aureogranulatus]
MQEYPPELSTILAINHNPSLQRLLGRCSLSICVNAHSGPIELRDAFTLPRVYRGFLGGLKDGVVIWDEEQWTSRRSALFVNGAGQGGQYPPVPHIDRVFPPSKFSPILVLPALSPFFRDSIRGSTDGSANTLTPTAFRLSVRGKDATIFMLHRVPLSFLTYPRLFALPRIQKFLPARVPASYQPQAHSAQSSTVCWSKSTSDRLHRSPSVSSINQNRSTTTIRSAVGLATLAMMVIPAVIASPSLFQHIRLLNLALTLEHAMQSMYDEAAANYTFDDYAKSGYPASVKGRYAQMQDHGNAHTKIITDAVVNGGGEAIGACTYKFPSTDVESFLAVSEYMETMAVSTYNGMLEHFEDKSLLTLVASIMNTKARHAAYINSIQQLNAWGTPFDYPLSLNMSFNIIGTFIHRGTCPKTNNLVTMLPIGVSDVAEITFLSTPLPGATVGLTLAYLPGPIPDTLFGAFITGTDTYYSEVHQDANGGMSLVIPGDVKAKGAVYVLLVSPDADGNISGDVEKEAIFAGPTLTMFSFASEGEAVGEHKFSLSV